MIRLELFARPTTPEAYAAKDPAWGLRTARLTPQDRELGPVEQAVLDAAAAAMAGDTPKTIAALNDLLAFMEGVFRE